MYARESAIDAGVELPKQEQLSFTSSVNRLNSSYYGDSINIDRIKGNKSRNQDSRTNKKMNSFYYFDPKLEDKLLSKEEFTVAKLKILKFNRGITWFT